MSDQETDQEITDEMLLAKGYDPSSLKSRPKRMPGCYWIHCRNRRGGEEDSLDIAQYCYDSWTNIWVWIFLGQDFTNHRLLDDSPIIKEIGPFIEIPDHKWKFLK